MTVVQLNFQKTRFRFSILVCVKNYGNKHLKIKRYHHQIYDESQHITRDLETLPRHVYLNLVFLKKLFVFLIMYKK